MTVRAARKENVRGCESDLVPQHAALAKSRRSQGERTRGEGSTELLSRFGVRDRDGVEVFAAPDLELGAGLRDAVRALLARDGLLDPDDWKWREESVGCSSKE